MIASFSRSGGSVSVGTLSINVDDVKLYDGNDQSGILDAPTPPPMAASTIP